MPKGRFVILAKCTSAGGHFLPDRFLPPVGAHLGCRVFPDCGEMSIRAQKGLRMFPGGGGIAFGAHLGYWVFPSCVEMSIWAQNGRHVFPRGGGVAGGAHLGRWVFPGASRVAGGVHFGVHWGVQLMAEPQTILSAVLGKRKNAPV